jgi:hypothetical protein
MLQNKILNDLKNNLEVLNLKQVLKKIKKFFMN